MLQPLKPVALTKAEGLQNANQVATINCACFTEKIAAYLDEELSDDDTACFLQHASECSECQAFLAEAQSFEGQLTQALAAVSPPEGFAQRVMQALPPMVQPALEPKIVKFPVRKWVTGVGTVAAAAVLVFGISLANPEAQLPLVIDTPNPNVAVVSDPGKELTLPAIKAAPKTDQPVVASGEEAQQPPEVPAAKPVVKTPSAVKTQDGAGDKATASVPKEQPANQPSQPANQPQVEANGSIDLPRAAYGTKSEGTLSSRLIANFEKENIYAPSISKDGENLFFFTQNKDTVYMWESSLSNPGEPKSIGKATTADLDGKAASLTCPTHDVNTALFSPDKIFMAMNLRGEETGVWVSKTGKDDKPWRLCGEGGGKFLTWAPNSSKLLFTDDKGVLYVGYPIEKRIFVVTEDVVLDLAWSKDSKTVALLVQGAGKATNSLYVVEIP